LFGSALWILNIYLVLSDIEEGNLMRFATREDAAEVRVAWTTVFPTILIVCFVLDIFITINITKSYKILCKCCCKDRVIENDA